MFKVLQHCIRAPTSSFGFSSIGLYVASLCSSASVCTKTGKCTLYVHKENEKWNRNDTARNEKKKTTNPVRTYSVVYFRDSFAGSGWEGRWYLGQPLTCQSNRPAFIFHQKEFWLLPITLQSLQRVVSELSLDRWSFSASGRSRTTSTDGQPGSVSERPGTTPGNNYAPVNGWSRTNFNPNCDCLY